MTAPCPGRVREVAAARASEWSRGSRASCPDGAGFRRSAVGSRENGEGGATGPSGVVHEGRQSVAREPDVPASTTAARPGNHLRRIGDQRTQDGAARYRRRRTGCRPVRLGPPGHVLGPVGRLAERPGASVWATAYSSTPFDRVRSGPSTSCPAAAEAERIRSRVPRLRQDDGEATTAPKLKGVFSRVQRTRRP